MTSPTTSRLRVLLAINGTDFGGTETALAEIAHHLERRGHRVYVLSMMLPGRAGRRMMEDRIDVHTLRMPETVTPLNMIAATRRFVDWLNRHEVDVIQSFLPRANVISRVANRLSRGHRPHLSSERSTDFNRSPMTCRLNRWTAGWTDRILAVSTQVEDVIVARDGLPAEKIHILENGIDAKRAEQFPRTDIRKALGLTADDLVFCSVGRLIPDKGFVYLAQAMARMENTAHMVLVGEGGEGKRIRREVAERGFEDRFHMVGFRSDVLGIMKDADLYVLSSLEEGIPVVLVEAMAVGLPVVSTRVGGIEDLVVEGETALLVPPAELWQGSPEGRTSVSARVIGVNALAAAMDRLAANPAERHRFGLAGRRRIKQVFGLDRIIGRLEDHYAATIAALGVR